MPVDKDLKSRLSTLKRSRRFVRWRESALARDLRVAWGDDPGTAASVDIAQVYLECEENQTALDWLAIIISFFFRWRKLSRHRLVRHPPA